MHALLNEDQEDLKRIVESLATSIGVANPTDVAERDFATGWTALRGAGLLELRGRIGDEPVASGVEVMVAAEALAAELVPLPFVPSAVLATELMALASAPQEWSDELEAGTSAYGILLDADLSDVATASDSDTTLIWGGPTTSHVLRLEPQDDQFRLVRLTLRADVADNQSIDLTQGAWKLPEHTSETADGLITADQLDTWRALALAAVCADTVGLMRAALSGAVEYSKSRIAYGVPIGSFQAIQHIAADTLVAIEAAYGATCYAAWCIDAVEPATALLAARTAKAHCAHVARTATENVMQIYGGVGQTWEHIAHFYTRRALLNTELLGNENVQLGHIADARLEGI